MKLDDGKTISLSERLSAFLADHNQCGCPLDTVRDGALVTLTCGECGRSFSYASRVPERSTEELVKALDRLSSAVEATGSPTSDAGANGSAAASLAAELRTKQEPAPEPVDEDPVWTWTPALPTPPRRPRRRKRLAPPGPFAPEARRRHSTSADEAQSNGRTAPPGPLAPRRIRVRGIHRVGGFHRVRRVRRGLGRVADQAGHRRREIALTVLGLGGAYLIVALGSGAEPSSSRPGEAVQGQPVNALVESGAGTQTSATEAQPLATPDNPPAPVTRDRVTLLSNRFSVVLPNGWRRAEPLGGAAILRAPDGTARVVVLPAALTSASGEEPVRTLRVGGRSYAVVVRSSPEAGETALDGADVVVGSLRPAG